MRERMATEAPRHRESEMARLAVTGRCKKTGLLINFNSALLKNGIKRLVL
jgi:hypothetical protein